MPSGSLTVIGNFAGHVENVLVCFKVKQCSEAPESATVAILSLSTLLSKGVDDNKPKLFILSHSFKIMWLVSFPPNLLVRVASFLCPGAPNLHLSLLCQGCIPQV